MLVSGDVPPPWGSGATAARVPSGESSGCQKIDPGPVGPGAIQSGAPPVAGTACRVSFPRASPITPPDADMAISLRAGAVAETNWPEGREYTLSVLEVAV